MRDGLTAAAVFAFAALAMLMAGRFLLPDIQLLHGVVQGLGTLLLLLVPVILITTYLKTSHATRP